MLTADLQTRGLFYPFPAMAPRLVSRTLEPACVNRVANDPAVRPWLGGNTPVLDLTALVEDPQNVVLMGPSGGFVCVQQGYARYEVHSLFLPDRPKDEAIRAAAASLDYMFFSTDALELVTKLPESNKAAAGLARIAGFQTLFESPIRMSPDHVEVTGCASLRLDRWVLRSESCLSMGAWFHDALEQAKMATGSHAEIHADDPVHTRMAGAVALMVRAGNAKKAIPFYNEWARLAGYATIRLLSEHPVLLDIQDAVLAMAPEGLEVVSCQ